MSASKSKVIKEATETPKPRRRKPEPPPSQTVKEGEDSKPKTARSPRHKREAAPIEQPEVRLPLELTKDQILPVSKENIPTEKAPELSETEDPQPKKLLWDHLKAVKIPSWLNYAAIGLVTLVIVYFIAKTVKRYEAKQKSQEVRRQKQIFEILVEETSDEIKKSEEVIIIDKATTVAARVDRETFEKSNEGAGNQEHSGKQRYT